MEELVEPKPLRAYLVDDEPLALERLKRLLAIHSSITIAGTNTDPAQALAALNSGSLNIDVLFLDIQMPAITGFDLLSRLDLQPFVIFTTAYDEYALKAFEVNSIDYLLKPIEPEQLARAVNKLTRLRPAAAAQEQGPQFQALIKQLAASMGSRTQQYPRRIASRVGERISFLDLDSVTHFIAHDKLTYAIANSHRYSVDQTISELETRLDRRGSCAYIAPRW